MNTKNISKAGLLALGLLIALSCNKHDFHFCSNDHIVTTTKVFATGLNNPRGLKFGPDGYLYVAEGGVGGTNSTSKCVQVIPPVGPYTGSDTGSRISRINYAGVRTTWVDRLPSSQTTTASGSLVSGVADVAFIGHTLYAVFSGAGCSHGVPDIPNGVIKINSDRSWTMIANMSQFFMDHPVKNPEEDDFEPDGTIYSMLNVQGNLYVLEPNHGELDKVTPGGNITRVVDISASQGHVVPTVQAFHNGNFYVGNLGVFPITGISNVYKITPSGQVSVFASGFSTILGIAFDQFGALYVLENTTGNPAPTPSTGNIIRITPSGDRQVIASGLNLPTGMTFGPDGKLYVSATGFGPQAIGGGEILQISIKCEFVHGDWQN